jgi:hypothetical protein
MVLQIIDMQQPRKPQILNTHEIFYIFLKRIGGPIYFVDWYVGSSFGQLAEQKDGGVDWSAGNKRNHENRILKY